MSRQRQIQALIIWVTHSVDLTKKIMITNYRNRGALIVNAKTPSFQLRFFVNILKMKCSIKAENLQL